MRVDRYAAAELKIYRQQPTARELALLLDEWGLTHATQEQLWVVAYDSIEQISNGRRGRSRRVSRT